MKKNYNANSNAANDLAIQYGRIDDKNLQTLKTKYNKPNLVKQSANQEMIGNLAYANKNGNGDVASGDGWKYRGRGMIQITGKGKYERINKRIKDDYPDFKTIIDTVNINNVKEGTVASMAYWKEYGLQEIAEKGYEEKQVNEIVNIVNRDTDSRDKRLATFKKLVEVFAVKSCSQDISAALNKEQAKTGTPFEELRKMWESFKSIGKWRNPVDNPQITIYTQGGHKRPWRSAFGMVRPDLGRPHHGLDLFAEIGTKIYACLPGKVVFAGTTGGYGKIVVLKIDNNYLEVFHNSRRNYQPYYVKANRLYKNSEYDISGFGNFEEYVGIESSKDVYLKYAHLDSILISVNTQITVDNYRTTVLGFTGDTGAKGTKGPHLHFEISSKDWPNKENQRGFGERYNPAYYIVYKNELELSREERLIQDNTSKKIK